MNVHDENVGTPYLLTEDIGEKFAAFRTLPNPIKTPPPQSSLFLDSQEEIARLLGRALGDEHPVIRVKMSDLAESVISKIAEEWGDDAYVVSTCPEIAYPSQGATLGINRLISVYGRSLGIGQRPGYPSLLNQVRRVRANSERRRIVVAEDGMFTGSTMEYVVKTLQQTGANIVGVVVGFTCSQEAVRRVERLGVHVSVVNDYGPLLDWVPDHDFIPFTPGCGKVLGATLGSRVSPFYDYLHTTFCVPYLSRYAPIEQWASIPEEKGAEFSFGCMQVALSIFTEIEKMNNGRRIRIEDLIQSRQRVSIPVPLDGGGRSSNGELPARDEGVITFLAEHD